ncbi:hypothetical protein ADL22_19570 [Streptomyces sp. NRRL F-4489]|uniref:hypothetical protein n=1 Tax=Streptomyces sp. NRRL F-4489 TaxID=1609095 RepID=UPI00074888C2|nr:hypothetical protein [Streptomyces sp. NRRL F-4489]KUL38059.1 hypothetical protein ADL22_19570 [Streptomyces sp. NRRL F-4489]
MTVLPRLLMGSVERLVGRTPPAAIGAPVHAVVHTVCDDGEEPRVRALLRQALGGPGVDLLHLHSRDTDPGSTALEATAAIAGPVTATLGRVLTLVWLDPGVHAVRWDLRPSDDTPPGRCMAPLPSHADSEEGAPCTP